MSLRKRGNRYWYRFMWNGKWIEKSTRQGNKNVARQMEAAHRTALAKGEVGIAEISRVPTLKEFAEHSFLPYVSSTFFTKPKTKEYYEYGVKSLLGFDSLANARLDCITTETIGAYVASRQALGNEITTVNRHLQVLRRMFNRAMKWKKVQAKLETVEMLPGERRRERILAPFEEALYFAAARSEKMQGHSDPALLGDVYAILIDCGLRPEECFRLRPTNVDGDAIEIPYGKTENARRRVPMTPRVRAILDVRIDKAHGNQWVFPAPTISGHIEKSTLRKQHATALREATRLLREQTGDTDMEFKPFDLYTLRHTCLTRWAPHMDPWTLMRLAGHRDMSTTMRYIHPEDDATRLAMQRARESIDRRVKEAVERQIVGPRDDRDKIRDTDTNAFGPNTTAERVN